MRLLLLLLSPLLTLFLMLVENGRNVRNGRSRNSGTKGAMIFF